MLSLFIYLLYYYCLFACYQLWIYIRFLPLYDVTKYRTARTAYTARTALRVDVHGG